MVTLYYFHLLEHKLKETINLNRPELEDFLLNRMRVQTAKALSQKVVSTIPQLKQIVTILNST